MIMIGCIYLACRMIIAESSRCSVVEGVDSDWLLNLRIDNLLVQVIGKHLLIHALVKLVGIDTLLQYSGSVSGLTFASVFLLLGKLSILNLSYITRRNIRQHGWVYSN